MNTLPIAGNTPLLQIESLYKSFPTQHGLFGKAKSWNHILNGISFQIKEGECLGLVGESGCGKSTLARCITAIERPDKGIIRLMGEDISRMSSAQLRPLRQHVQMVFQDPADSLNPRMNIGQIIGEGLLIQGMKMRDARYQSRIFETLELVGLPSKSIDKYPHEFSGGQRQRIGIARAIILRPKLLILDEALSSLDLSIQAQIINLLLELQQELKLAYLFISHDLSVVMHISDRIAVMHAGKIVELASAEQLYKNPSHDYTRALLNAIPSLKPPKASISPILAHLPKP